HRGIATVVSQEFVDNPFRTGVFDFAALAGRELAHEGRVNSVLAVRNAGHFEIRRRRPVAHVSWILAEWTFGLNGIRGNNSFYDYFRSRGNKQIDGLACHDRHGLSRKATGNSIFIEVVWYLRGSRISDVRGDAEGKGGRKRHALGFALTPMQSHVLRRKETARTVRGFNLAAII